MIFTTLKERNETFDTIGKKEKFADLTERQNDCVQGMYLAIESLEHLKCEYENSESKLEELVNEISTDAIEEAIQRIEIVIAEMVVSFRDSNAEE